MHRNSPRKPWMKKARIQAGHCSSLRKLQPWIGICKAHAIISSGRWKWHANPRSWPGLIFIWEEYLIWRKTGKRQLINIGQRSMLARRCLRPKRRRNGACNNHMSRQAIHSRARTPEQKFCDRDRTQGDSMKLAAMVAMMLGLTTFLFAQYPASSPQKPP